MDVKGLKELCLRMKEQKEVVGALDKQKKEEQKTLDKMQAEIMEHLNAADLKNFDFEEGKVIKAQRTSVKVLDKYALAEYLKKEGRFDDLFSFNSMTINSYYKEQLEQAIEREDLDFKVEGLSDPVVFEYLQVRKK